ncbi:MAG: hypothetical protein ACRENI_07290 [Gemmatimonadaceae bacterium]
MAPDVAEAHAIRPVDGTSDAVLRAIVRVKLVRGHYFGRARDAERRMLWRRRLVATGADMRRLILACALCLGATPSAGGAQEPDSTRREAARLDPQALPDDVVREVTGLYNSPATMRVIGRMEIVAGREVAGDLAILDGPLVVGGRVSGDVVVINGDLLLRPGGWIDGDIVVVGGIVTGEQDAHIGGSVRVYREVLHFREDGDRIVADRRQGIGDEGGIDDDVRRWWQFERARSRSRLHLFSASTYNRVEGLPVLIGPRIVHEANWGTARLEVFGIIRTADNFKWDSENLGHRVLLDLTTDDRRRITLGGMLFDEVRGVEEWHLTDSEIGLASFFLHRDYRDYYDRHGAGAHLLVRAGRDVDLDFRYSDERWGSRRTRDPFTLFRNGQQWRINPAVDDGRFHIGTATLRIDTRNDEDNPWSGWLVTADYELGSGDVVAFGATSPLARPAAPDPDVTYHRGFLDLRSYNRVTPDAQLNFRLVLGGWLGGDELPLQRRFSLAGPGTLPGYDFRDIGLPGADVLACGSTVVPAPGAPAQCERVALAQVEYRGDIDVDLFDADDDDRRWFDWDVDFDADWIMFLDAGRGWLVGPRSGDLSYPSGAVPELETFRTDAGVGLDVGIIGFYVAKSLSDSGEPANFFVRARHRF